MKVRFMSTMAIVSVAAALSGCVSYGNTNALVTPFGVAGVHSFKPKHNASDIHLPAPQNPDRVAAVQSQRSEQDDET
jgi:hypothetical protein